MNKDSKIQELYSIRNEIFNEVDSMSIVPEEVERIIKQAFQNLNIYYENQGVNYPITEEYITGMFEETKANIRCKENNDRRGEYWGQINYLFDTLEEKIVDGEEIQQSDVERFQISDYNRNKIVFTIVQELEEGLRNVQSTQRRLMSTRGCSDEQIEKIYYEAMKFMRSYMQDKDFEIASIYEKREKQLTDDVVNNVSEFVRTLYSMDNSLIEDYLNELVLEMQRIEDLLNTVEKMIERMKETNQLDTPSKEALVEKLKTEMSQTEAQINKVNSDLQEMKAINPEQNSAKKDFKSSIDVTGQLSLGQQRENSIRFGSESEKATEQKSTDILQDLFE